MIKGSTKGQRQRCHIHGAGQGAYWAKAGQTGYRKKGKRKAALEDLEDFVVPENTGKRGSPTPE